MEFAIPSFTVTPSQAHLNFLASAFPSHTPGTVPSNLTIYLKQIKITNSLRTYINKKLAGEKHLKLGWSFHSISDLVLIPRPIYDNTKFKLHLKKQYTLEVDDHFTKTLSQNPVMFTLYVRNDKTIAAVNTSKLHLDDILDNVNKKESAVVEFYLSKVSQEPVAQLKLWYKLSCSKKGIYDLVTTGKMCRRFEKNRINLAKLMPKRQRCVNRELDDGRHGSVLSSLEETMVVNRAEDETAEQERVLLRYDDYWNNADVDIDSIDWDEWMHLHEVHLEEYIVQNPTSLPPEPELTITVVALYFLEGSTPLRKKTIKQVYVEYSFLGNEGLEMEAPFTVPIGTLEDPSVFNWTKTFEFDVDHNYAFCKSLVDAISDNRVVRFMVISEPKESLSHEIPTCEEVGYAEVFLGDVVELPNDCDTYQYEILDFENPLVVVGYMVICFSGILAVKDLVSRLSTSATE